MNTYNLSLNQKSKYIDQLFTYKSEEDYEIGEFVNVSFGMGNKILKAIVVQKNISKPTQKTKEIIKKDQDSYPLTKRQVEAALYIRNQYMCSFYEAFRLFTPPGNYSRENENFTQVIEVKNERGISEIIKTTRKNAKNKLAFYKALDEFKTITRIALEEYLGFNANNYLKEAKEFDLIEISKRKVYATNEFEKKHPENIDLNDEQVMVLCKMLEIYKNEENKNILLHGITGSGKTIVYINLIKKILSLGKTAMILVPEISLTSQTISRFKNEFDEDIAIIHSGLTPREKFDQWVKIKNGISKIVIGARSALFSPLENIGSIIIDECHDEAYKSEMPPKYDTIEMAQYIAMQHKAVLVLSSATPTIKQYYMAKEKNFYHLLKLTKRANKKPLPNVIAVDMIDEMKSGNTLDISRTLETEIKLAIAEKNQVILFINKRGYSNNLTCDNCGYVPKCENCDITLTYHKTTNTYKCHYCGYETKSLSICPSCNEGHFIMMGSGTQKIQQQVENMFPNANIFRMDKDVTKGQDIAQIINYFKKTPSSILIGTQMIGKGHDFPLVSLVGVINADQGINSPDYRAMERTYNLLEQVGGRAGRGEKEGKVIVQTYSKNRLMFYLKTHDYDAFYEDEIQKRKIFSYEPFGNIIKITVFSNSEKEAYISAKKIEDALKYYNEIKFENKLKIYDAAPCIINRIDKKYRYQIIVRCTNEMLFRTKKMINYTMTNKRKIVLTSTDVYASIDVNPDNML